MYEFQEVALPLSFPDLVTGKPTFYEVQSQQW